MTSYLHHNTVHVVGNFAITLLPHFSLKFLYQCTACWLIYASEHQGVWFLLRLYQIVIWSILPN